MTPAQHRLDAILVYNPATRASNLLMIDRADSHECCTSGVLSITTGLIFSAGRDGLVLAIDPDTNSTAWLRDASAVGSFAFGASGLDGRLYFLGHTNVLVVDPNPAVHVDGVNRTVQLNNTQVALSPSMTYPSAKHWGAYLAPNGNIYSVPGPHTNYIAILQP